MNLRNLFYSCAIASGSYLGLLSAETILTFDQACALTFADSPKLKASEAEIEERLGDSTQAKALPNPLVGYSVENVFGNKNWRNWNAAETRYELAQLIEIGGKRHYRSSVAKSEYFAAVADYEATKLQILNQLLKQFATVAAMQEHLQLAENQLKTAEEVLNAVKGKVDAGKVSPVQQHKAEIQLADAEMDYENAKVDLETAKEKLSLFWGSCSSDFDRVEFCFFTLIAPKALDDCFNDLEQHPDVLRMQFEQQAAFHALELEKSAAIPDITVSVGYKTIQDTHHKGMILGAAIPLPIFDRNQGNIYRAKSEIIEAEQLALSLQLSLENKLAVTHRELQQAYNQADRFQKSVLKSAEQSFSYAKGGFNEGKFEYLDMLDAQRTLFDVREKYIQAVLNYHLKRADLEYLNGKDE